MRNEANGTKNRSIALMGMKHCGKSSIGRRLARELRVPFIDLDDRLTAIAPPGAGESPRAIFRNAGAGAFRRYEAQAAQEVVADAVGRRVIVALGGGTVMNEAAMASLRSNVVLIYLMEEAEVLYRRIRRKGIPAFLDPHAPEAHFRRLYAERTARYETEADGRVDLRGMSFDDAYKAVLRAVEEYTYAGQ